MPRTQRRPSIRRSLTYYWRMHLAVTLGAAVTSAVLTGALLVGDSVRGSLRDLTLERLGKIAYSLSSAGFFRELLASDLQTTSEAEVAPAILLQGSAVHAQSQRRASGVSILGIDDRFLELFPEPEGNPQLDLDSMSGPDVPPSVAINQALRDELEAEIGDSILLSFSKKAAVNPEFILGGREAADLYRTLRLTVTRIMPNQSIGRFSLNPHQTIPYNVYLPLTIVQDALIQKGRVNALLVSGAGSDVSAAMFGEDLREAIKLDDFGLRWRKSNGDAVLESREMLISPSIEEDIWAATSLLGIERQPVLTYLANRITSENGTIPYSTVSAVDNIPAGSGNRVQLVSGQNPAKLNKDEILLNEWAAQELGVVLEDKITLTYYVADWQENLISQSKAFRLKGILPMEGLAIDETLTPEIPGVHDAADMASWNPPIPIDFGQIRPQDEEYWDLYKAAPKAFLSYEAGLELWRNRFGKLTSVRFQGANRSQEEIESALLQTLKPEQLGRFRATRDEGLRAAAGATDFGMLFIGFSLFLIVSAVLLVGLMFRLGMENRARELGLLLSLGYSPNTIRRRFLLEGMLLATAGSLLGLGLAWTYAGLLIRGLQTVWVEAIGSSFLTMHVQPFTLVIGFAVSLIAVSGSMVLTFRSLAKLPATTLLRGATEQMGPVRSRWAGKLAAGSLGAAALLLLSTTLISAESSPLLFFGLGIALLVSGLSWFAVWVRRERPSAIGSNSFLPTMRMAIRNSARSPGRSLLSITLVATASFVIVAVGANRSLPGDEVFEKDSGAGGYVVRAQSDVALVRDLNSPEARFDLGFSEVDTKKLQNTEFGAYRLLPGEDISCRNLYQPSQPRLLGVPKKQVERGGFRFQSLVRETENPWTLLQEDLGPGVIPAFGDANSVTWILHRSLGDDLTIGSEDGREVRLRIVGLLSKSIFQSEVLISEENFQKHFPSQSGYSYFLIQTPIEQIEETNALLEKALSRYGFDTTPTQQLLAGFFAVENTYLSTFQSLGGLGLLLGTLGLGIILIRNTMERRGELATLRAFGFSRKTLSILVLMENCFLLGLGLFIGTLSALIAVAPHLLSMSDQVPWGSLSLTLLGVYAAGALASALSLQVALKVPLLSTLREE